MTARQVSVVIPTGFGINCEIETAEAFKMAGAKPRLIHLNDLVADPSVLASAELHNKQPANKTPKRCMHRLNTQPLLTPT